MWNVVALMVDNCKTRKATSRLNRFTFLQCYSHQFNRYVQDIIGQHRYKMTKIPALIKRLSFNISAAKLQLLTPLRAVQCNRTRYSSMYANLKRFCDFELFLIRIGDGDIQALLSTNDEKIDAHNISKTLEDMDSIIIKLQLDSVKMFDTGILFIAMKEQGTMAKKNLDKDASIVENVAFEKEMVKNQSEM